MNIVIRFIVFLLSFVGGVPNVEMCRSQKFTSLCCKGSKTSDLSRHLHFENTTLGVTIYHTS